MLPRMRRPPVLTLLVAGMLVLLPMLAVLQFRWLGQLSDAERERLQRNLRATTADITTALDLELARIMVGLQIDGGTLRDEAWDRYAERHAAWSAAALDASLVQDVLLVDAEGRQQTDPVRVRRWDAGSHTFVPAEWPDAFTSLGARIADERRAFAAKGEGPFLRPSELFTADGATLVLPATPIAPLLPDGTPGRLIHVFGFTIVRLDLRTMQTLLRYFIEHRGATISRDELLNEVWGYHAMPTTRTVDVHVAWLRQKLERNPKHPQYIHTVHGLGYKFVDR